MNKAIAYVDGSYDKRDRTFSYGDVILYNGKEHHLSNRFSDPQMASMRNVAGEILGAETAMRYCVDRNIPNLDLYYDYEGIEKWYTGKWRANKEGTIRYAKLREELPLNVSFFKVRAHTGDKYNELADQLAKDAKLNTPKETVIEYEEEVNDMYDNLKLQYAFANIRIRYEYLKECVKSLKIKAKDSVTVFVNIESVFLMLCNFFPDGRVVVDDNVLMELESLLIDVAAHYRYFFKQTYQDVKVILYYTDPDSNHFMEQGIYEAYREPYLDRFRTTGAGASGMTVMLKEHILGSVKMLLCFVPNAYMVSVPNIDSGLIPSILGDDGRENIIITTDHYDMQYMTQKGYHVIYKTRKGNAPYFICNMNEMSEYFLGSKEHAKLLKNPTILRLIMSCRGNQKRSIPHVNGVGAKTAMKYILEGLEKHYITEETRNIELFLPCFPEDVSEDILRNYALFDYQTFRKSLGNGSVMKVKEQLVDRSDINALKKLNDTRYRNRPFWLDGLL